MFPKPWKRLAPALLTLLWAAAALASPADSLRLLHPVDELERRISGDGATVLTGGEIELRARVLGPEGRPVAGIPVSFTRVEVWNQELELTLGFGSVFDALKSGSLGWFLLNLFLYIQCRSFFLLRMRMIH